MTKVIEAQAGFIPGKHIGDDIRLATELLKGYTNKHISPICVIKVDLKKPYDYLEWSFLETVMLEMGFHLQFVRWVMKCVTTVSFSILLNGKPTPLFQAKKGLRQGDPMSPFLFALGMEYLSRCLNDLKADSDFNYHPRCEKLSITYMMFTDDLLLFDRAGPNSIKMLFSAFQKFSKASGLEANLDKSAVYFGGIKVDEQHAIQQTLPVPQGSFPFRYLGVPLTYKKLNYA